MSTRKKLLKSKESVPQEPPISSESTPVKRTKKQTATPAVSPLLTNLVDDDVQDTSPDVQFSPLIKPLQSDIEWAWKSPKGRLPKPDSSGAVTKRRILNVNKTPLQAAKRRSQLNSPLSNPPLKRKLIKVDRKEEDHFSSLTSEWQALTESRNLLLVENKSRDVIEENDGVECKSTTDEAVLSAANVDNFSGLMDDDDDCFALLCCSQVVEAKLIENPTKEVFSPIIVKTSTISNSTNEIQTSTPKLRKTSLSCNQEQKSPNRKYANIAPPLEKSPMIFPNLHSTDTIKISNNSFRSLINNNLSTSFSLSFQSKIPIPIHSNKETMHDSKAITAVFKPQQKSNQTTKESTSDTKLDSNFECAIKDDSFDNILLSVYDENIDQLSNTVMESAVDPKTKNIQSTELQHKPSNLSENKRRDIRTTTATETRKTTLTLSNDGEEDFLQPELLSFLEKIESSSVVRQGPNPSPPLQCTPEEIEKKRRLAKVKLAQKKIAMLKGIHRLPNPFRRSK